jgi:hypothetical protein
METQRSWDDYSLKSEALRQAARQLRQESEQSRLQVQRLLHESKRLSEVLKAHAIVPACLPVNGADVPCG